MKRASNLPVVIVLVATFFLLTFSSYAAEPTYSTKEPVVINHPFYLGVLGGFIVPDDLVPDTGTSLQLEDSWAAGAKAGYIFPFRWLAAELEYDHLGDHDIEKPGTGQFRADNLMANIIFRYPEGMIRPYIGAGVGWSRGDIEAGPVDETANDFGWQALAGINLEIIPSLSVDFGYRYFTSEYGFGSEDATLKDHILSVGFNYHFGGKQPEPPPPPPPPEPVKVKKCPDTPACCVVDEDGCPKDSDKDGVCDGCDKCPDTPDCCVVDENGCPKDSDKDGVCDGCDKCPDTPEGCAVDENGCPKDSDKDGVIDCMDKCPDTPEVAKVDKNGCPITAVITLMVQFDYDKAIVKPAFYGEIKKLADFMKKHPNLDATIEGHTCNIASAKYNLGLSSRRAEAIKKALIEREGIDPKRLKAVGYGLTRPITTNDTEEGRSKNRRVEAHLEAQELRK